MNTSQRQLSMVTPLIEASSNHPIQTKCPVTGNDVDRSFFEGRTGDENNPSIKVYFCCDKCIDKFKENPDRYLKKLEDMKQPVETLEIKRSDPASK